MTIEDRLRAAAQAAAQTVADGSAPPLRLPEADKARAWRPAGRRWPGWLAPLGAAAAAAAIIIGWLALPAAIGGSPPRPAGAASDPAALRDLPPYYVVLPGAPFAQQAQVRATVTGAVVATIRPPRPYGAFSWVSGAADGRTFVLATQRYRPMSSSNPSAQTLDNSAPTRFLRLRLGPGGRPAARKLLTLPVAPAGEDLAGIGLSPGASRLALALFPRGRPAHPAIQVVTLTGGTVRTWTWPGGGWIGNGKPYGQVLSWSADGRLLEFQHWDSSDPSSQVRILDTTAPGRSLGASRLVTVFPNRAGGRDITDANVLLTPDGSKVIASAETFPLNPHGRPGRVEIDEFSARTGKLIRWRDRWVSASLPWQNVLWTDRTGQRLIIADPRGKDHGSVIGLLAGGTFTPLPGAADIPDMAW